MPFTENDLDLLVKDITTLTAVYNLTEPRVDLETTYFCGLISYINHDILITCLPFYDFIDEFTITLVKRILERIQPKVQGHLTLSVYDFEHGGLAWGWQIVLIGTENLNGIQISFELIT